MPNTTFEEIWSRIVTHEGETFHTITDKPFTYEIEGAGFYPSRTHYRISKSDFRKAYQMVPIDGPGVINRIDLLLNKENGYLTHHIQRFRKT